MAGYINTIMTERFLNLEIIDNGLDEAEDNIVTVQHVDIGSSFTQVMALLQSESWFREILFC